MPQNLSMEFPMTKSITKKLNPMQEKIFNWKNTRINEIKRLKKNGTAKQELIDRFGHELVNVALSMKG